MPPPAGAAAAAAACLRIVEDDRIVWTTGDASTATASTTTTASDFIKSRPAGAYTTARTSCHGTRVFDLERHVERLAESSTLLGGGGGGRGGGGGGGGPPPPPLPRPPASLSDAVLLRPRVVSLLRLGLLGEGARAEEEGRGISAPRLSRADPSLGPGEFRVTILATWGGGREGDGQGSREGEERAKEDEDEGETRSGRARRRDSFSLSLHVAPLPPPRSQPVVALLAPSRPREGLRGAGDRRAAGGSGGRRRTASAKSSSWVSERASLELEAREAGAEEFLLVETEEEEDGGEEEEGGGGEEEEGGGESKRSASRRRLILEGLSSNFAAVAKTPLAPAASSGSEQKDDEGEEGARYGAGYELQTAPDGSVLSGTVRSLLLDVVAPRAGFTVRRRRRRRRRDTGASSEGQRKDAVGLSLSAPSVEDAERGLWVGALLLSTSRLALPVAELREKKERSEEQGTKEQETEDKELEDEEKAAAQTTAATTSLVARFFGKGQIPHPVVSRLSRDVAAAVESASESLLVG